MTMSAGLIAELANIDLKDGDPGGAKREQSDAIELRFKGWAARGCPEDLQLLHRGGEGAVLSEQGQCHRILCGDDESDLELGRRMNLCG